MGSRDGEATRLPLAVLPGNGAHAIGGTENLSRLFKQGLTRGGYAGQMLATALEKLYPKIIFQLPDLFTYSRLGSVQVAGGGGDIQIVFRHLDKVA